MGSLGRKHGFAADHVTAVEIVTADGRLRRICADSEPELFWAVRGGKGNLGIVTALEIELVPVASLFGGGIFFAGDDAAARCCTASASGRRRCPRRSAPRSRSCGCPDMEELPPPLRGQTVVHLRFAYAGTTTPRPSGCSRR